MKAKCQRTDAFKLWCWRRRLRVPWTARRSNQSILGKSVLSIHWKDWCWSWNANPLATWCEELTHLKRPWCWEGLKAEGEGDDRGWDGWMASPTQWTWVWVNSGSLVMDREAWHASVHAVAKSQTGLSFRQDWATELNLITMFPWWLSSKESACSAGDTRDTRPILSQEDPLEKEMATHSSILAWEITWTEESGGPQSMGSQESDLT